MKHQATSAALLAAALAFSASACGTSASANEAARPSTSGKGKTITVWLQADAQNGWPAVVQRANRRFEQATGAKVRMQWQS